MRATTGGTASARKAAIFWLDPRFVIGLLLVAASVGGVIAIVSAADRSLQVYAAREPLSVGDLITADDVVYLSVRVDDAETLYLVDGDMPATGLIVTKPVAAGELVPTSAVGSAAGLRYTALVITVSSRLAGSIQPGSLVDLWASRETDAGGFGPPSVLVSSATVVRLIEDDGFVVGETAITVEVLVPKSKVARVLEAIANRDALSLVPVNLPVGG